HLLDEEKLTLLAAPRTSMARNTELLKQVTGRWVGAGFWGLLDADRIICLNAVVSDVAADPGFRSGEAKLIADTRIAGALQRRTEGFVGESGGGPATMLVPISSRRGHDLGWIGITLPAAAGLPDSGAVRDSIRAASAAD